MSALRACSLRNFRYSCSKGSGARRTLGWKSRRGCCSSKDVSCLNVSTGRSSSMPRDQITSQSAEALSFSVSCISSCRSRLTSSSSACPCNVCSCGQEFQICLMAYKVFYTMTPHPSTSGALYPVNCLDLPCMSLMA